MEGLLPHGVGQGVPDGLHEPEVGLVPGVEVEAAHLGDVCAQVAVDPAALDADEGAEVEGGPGRGPRPAVCAGLVAGDTAQTLGLRVVLSLPCAAGPLEGDMDLLLDGRDPVRALLLGAQLELPLPRVQGHDDQLEERAGLAG